MNSDVKDLGVRKQLIFLFFSFIVVACVLSGCSNARGSDSVKESKTEASRGNDPLIGVIIEATGDIVYTEEERQTSLLKLQGNVNQSERAGYSVQPTTEEEVAYVPIDAEPVYTADLLDNYVPILPEPSVQESTIQPVTLNQIPSEPFSEIAKDTGGSGNTDVLKTPDVLPTSSPAPAVDVSKNITPQILDILNSSVSTAIQGFNLEKYLKTAYQGPWRESVPPDWRKQWSPYRDWRPPSSLQAPC